MTSRNSQQQSTAMWSSLGVGVVFLSLAIFFDPIGSTPETGVIDLGTTGTKVLLGAFGVFFIAGAAWVFIKNKFFGST